MALCVEGGCRAHCSQEKVGKAHWTRFWMTSAVEECQPPWKERGEKIRNRDRGKGGSKCRKQHQALEWKNKTNSQLSWPSSSVSLQTEKGMSLELSSSKSVQQLQCALEIPCHLGIKSGQDKVKKIYTNRNRKRREIRGKSWLCSCTSHLCKLPDVTQPHCTMPTALAGAKTPLFLTQLSAPCIGTSEDTRGFCSLCRTQDSYKCRDNL